MSFETRTATAEKLIDTLQKYVFASCGPRLKVVPFGYETHIPEDIRKLLRYERVETARHIKFAPDFFVVDASHPGGLYLLEFKATQTPLYSHARIDRIRSNAGDPTLDWDNIGQMEALAWENYEALKKLNVRVAILNYCAYYAHPLLCDFIENFKVVHRDVIRTGAGQGSGTPWINFDVRSIRRLAGFVCEEHGFDVQQVDPLVNRTEDILKKELPVQHHPYSPHFLRGH